MGWGTGDRSLFLKTPHPISILILIPIPISPVLKVKITERRRIVHTDPTLPASYRYLIGYQVQVLAIYKGVDMVGNGTGVWVHTPDAGRLCGVTGMLRDDIYLVSGRGFSSSTFKLYCAWA